MSARAVSLSSTASDLVSLTKPSLSSLVIITTAGGMWLAPGALSPGRALVTLLATSGTVGAANALNCYLERHSDQFMARTRNRPLPAGRMDPAVALWFGISLAAVSLPALALGANLLTAGLGLLALLSYVLAYTPLKARTSAAMLVGAVPGALPPLMGWTAVTNVVDSGGFALFAILFLWQMPHFLAIALFRKEEYAAAGLKSVPLERGDESSRAQLVLYVVALVPMTLLPFQLNIAGVWYLAAAAGLGLAFLAMGAWGFFKQLGKPWARQTFFYSLLYLTGLFAALMLDRVPRG
ncbi:protoheme IX farnesyltransferase [Corallococcus sp. H22C18031201]|uniref:heme o synthase n=1 Tax=Citreicoccus inhibens TaxID=2849499 RepID=UPI000E753D71|nr:heme o synthase [Citreicoccus inhibens]MBU8898308.1 heme o synthase [Citreicoccus inhibens]RJS15623.1 protoheme IX farnesyltransferase [Corallococcus sp. H22C18031201]